MKQWLFALVAFFSSEIALGQTVNSPCYWSGQLTKCFPTTGVYLDGNRALRLGEATANGSNYVGIQAPASMGADYTLRLPAEIPAFGDDEAVFFPVVYDDSSMSWGSDTNSMMNVSVSTSVGSSALTIALKTRHGSDPGTTDPSGIAFRMPTATSGRYAIRPIAAATSLVISSGSTLGHTSGVEGIIYVYAIYPSVGAVAIGASSKLFDTNQLTSATAEGGAGAADSATVLYATAGHTSRPIRLIGKLYSTQATAGTWAAVPTVASPVGLRDVGTAEIADGTIANADVSASAAIAYSKLDLGTSIVNADVNASAAIDRSKLANGTASHVVINDGSGVMSSEASLAISRGGTGAATATAGFDALAPTTTRGDLIRRGASNNERVALGSAGKILTAGASDPAWQWQETSSGKSADYTVTDTDGITVILMTNGAAADTVTLPTASDNSGRRITIKKIDSGAGGTVVDGEGAETINDSANFTLYFQYEFVTVMCDGSEWWVVDLSANSSSHAVTFTGTWSTNTTYTAFETRVGTWAYYNVKVATSGAPDTATLNLTLPSGRTIDTSALANTEASAGNSLPHSTASVRDGGSAQYTGVVVYLSTTSVSPKYLDDGATAVVPNAINQAAPITFGNTDYVHMTFAVPIAEWSHYR